jgi:hypothetical protein
LLERLRLPVAAVVIRQEPPGDAGTLARPPTTQGTPDLVDRHRWWRVSQTPGAVLGFVATHLPKGGKKLISGASGGGGEPSSEFVAFTWPPVNGVLGTRELIVQVVGLTDGSTGVRADAQVVWMLPRPARERVPAAVRDIGISRGRPGHPPSLSLLVTNRAKVRKIVSMIDQLPTTQPGAWACPDLAAAALVTVRFLATPLGPALATATEPTNVTEPTSPCNPLSFTLRGKPQTPLLHGASFLTRTERILGVSLTGSP